MNVFYIKLKTGEELLATHTPVVDDTSDTVLIEGAISFEMDEETGVSLARYWVAYSDEKNVNLNLNDVYFFGKASTQAHKFYAAFQESVASRKDDDENEDDIPTIDDMSDDDLEDAFTKGTRTIH